jgi:hypothetical protein
MYQKIKALADEAIALQNKTRMDAVLREISALCNPELRRQLADAELLVSAPTGFRRLTAEQFEAAEAAQHKSRNDPALGDGYEMKIYGTAKTYDSEAEMIADIQGAPSPVFPLTPEQQVRHEARQAAKLSPEAGRSIDAAYEELKAERKAEEAFGLAVIKKKGAKK